MNRQSPYFTAIAAMPGSQELLSVAQQVYGQVFRRDFAAPGFALLHIPAGVGSRPLRRFMVALKDALAGLYHHDTGKHLVYLSLARFDQQETTKFHVDGAPEESYLMLGYEPSAVPSSVAIADYTRAAHEIGVEPKQYLAEFNPMYAAGAARLARYVAQLTEFDPTLPQVLLVNNSMLPFREDRTNSLGVMHQATVPQPVPDRSRVVNSTMIVSGAGPTDSRQARSAEQVFLETDAIAGKIYG